MDRSEKLKSILMKTHLVPASAARSSYGWYTSLQGAQVELVKKMMAQRSDARSRRRSTSRIAVMLLTLPELASNALLGAAGRAVPLLVLALAGAERTGAAG